MNAKIIFLVVLSTVLLTACSNEENLNGLSGDPKPAAITLKVESPRSRAAIDYDTNDEDSRINDLIVFVFRNSGDLDAPPVYVDAATLATTGIPTINGTTMASSIYVVTNTGTLGSGAFGNVAQLADLQKVALQVNGNPNPASNCISQNVWMTGSTTSLVDNGTSATGVAQKKATIQLYFVPAKVYVIVNNQMNSYSITGKTVLDGTAVVNGGSWTRFTPSGAANDYRPAREDLTTTTKTPFFYNGVDVDPLNYIDAPLPYLGNPDYVPNTIYKYTSAVFTTDGTFVATPEAEQGFYLFPPITNNLTYLTVYGRFAPQGASVSDPSVVPYYWSVAFNGADGILPTLESGKKYIVTITLNGNANNGGGGDDDPTREVVAVNIDVTVQVAVWNVVIQAEKIIS